MHTPIHLINRIHHYIENPSPKDAKQALHYLNALQKIVQENPQPVLVEFYRHLEQRVKTNAPKSASPMDQDLSRI